MGFFLRKSLGKIGPVRFNLSKSGIGVSGGVRGARIGIGPRGTYLAGGRGGLYYRKYLNTGPKKRGAAVTRVEQLQPDKQAQPSSESSIAPKPGGYGAVWAWGLGSVFFLVGSLPEFSVGPFLIGMVLLAVAVAVWRKRSRRIAWIASHDVLLGALGVTSNGELLNSVKRSLESSQFHPSEWQLRHEQVYTATFSEALTGGIDTDEKLWLDAVAAALHIPDRNAIHVEVLRAVLWQFMADGQVTEDEERLAKNLIRASGVSSQDLSEEFATMDEFVRARKVRESGLPVVEPGINLQRGEVCHHITRGAFLDKKILRSYTRDGQKYKEEGLVVAKQGSIYITSKRTLMVSDGTSSIPHEKILEIEVDQDEKLIEIIRDGRKNPLYLKVPDAVYTAVLIEILSETAK
jgi:hypothetical protein